MNVLNLSPINNFETCATSERRFIDDVVKDFVNEEDRALVLSWVKKWLADTLVIAGKTLEFAPSRNVNNAAGTELSKLDGICSRC